MRTHKRISEITLERAKEDPEFRAALLGQAIECITENDVTGAKKMLRDYVLASTGFEALSKRVQKKPESIKRMLSEKGNPTLNSLASLLSTLKKNDGIHIHVEATL